MLRVATLLLFATAVAVAGDFTPYAGSRNLCSEHVIGNTMHLEWSAWVSGDKLATVVAFYEKQLHATATTGTHGERTLVLGKDRNLSLYPATRYADFPHCDAKPDRRGDSTILLFSQAIR
jgi:hypothetical protein